MESELLPSEQEVSSNRILFKSQSLLEDAKWDNQTQDDPNKQQASRRSSHGGFFHGKMKGEKENNMEFMASIDLFEQKIIIKLDDSHRTGGNMQARQIVKEYSYRDILSAQQDESDGKILHLWIFKQKIQKKGCCKKTITRQRNLNDFQLIGQDEQKTREWASIIQCELEGVSQSEGMPRKRKILVLVNPFSGRRLAARNWEIARPILEKAYIEMKVIMTERAGHAYDIVNQEIKPGDYDGIVTVSGDGLIHEVVNGLYRRIDWLQLMSSLSIGFIPGGSANGLVKAVLDYAGEEYGVQSAAFLVAKGRTMKMDLTEIEAEYQPEKIYSFLCTFWGVLADCDINSEVIRWVGSARFTIWGIFRVICMRRYAGSIFFTGQKFFNQKDVQQINEDSFTPDLPEFHEEAVRHQEDPEQYRNVPNFSYVLIMNTPFIGSSIHSGPLAKINDGYNDIVLQTADAGRMRLTNILIQQDDGTYFDNNGNIKTSLAIDYLKTKSWRIDPLVKSPKPKDGTEIENNPKQVNEQSVDQRNNEEESKDTGATGDSNVRKPSNHSNYSNHELNQKLLEKKPTTEKVYRYDERAFFSIDGEKYPAQKIQGRVLKNALPIYC